MNVKLLLDENLSPRVAEILRNEQTLHKSERVARGYIRHAKLFDDNAAIGLL